MAIDFPNSPTVGQTFTQPGTGQVWKWDGTKWIGNVGVNPLGGVVLEVALANNQTGLTALAWNICKYDTKVTDTQNAYSTATGLFTPTVAGLYSVTATIGINQVAGGRAGVAICKNGAVTNAESQSSVYIPNVGGIMPSSCSALIYCNGTTDTISVQGYLPTGTTAFQNSANTLSTVNMVATLLGVGSQGPQGLPGGSLTLLQTQQVSNVAAATFTLPASTYKRFKIIFDCLQGFTAAAVTLIQGSSDGGSTWKNAGYIHAGLAGSAATPALTAIGNTNDLGFRPTGNIDMSTVLATVDGEITLIEPMTSGPVQVLWHTSVHSSGGYYFCTGGGRGPDTTVWNACRLVMSGGNITGNVSLYGMTQ